MAYSGGSQRAVSRKEQFKFRLRLQESGCIAHATNACAEAPARQLLPSGVGGAGQEHAQGCGPLNVTQSTAVWSGKADSEAGRLDAESPY